mmetsp:Transcript_28501/g.81629  ORF Transcript_28501/g.81629 Transcript_28501/m.81629 type:complete len:302 (-) Transcript_28501:38-943(-)
MALLFHSPARSVSAAHELEQEHEHVDDVQVQLDGGFHVVVHADLMLLAAHDHLCVVDDVEGEEEDPQPCIDLLHWRPRHRRVREEAEQGDDQTEHHQGHEARREVGPEACEVALGDARICREHEEDTRGGGEGQQDRFRGVQAGDEAGHDRDANGEHSQVAVVHRERPQSLAAAAAHHEHKSESTVGGHVVDSHVAQDPLPRELRVHVERNPEGHRELDGQQGVDLADEAASHLWRHLRYGRLPIHGRGRRGLFIRGVGQRRPLHLLSKGALHRSALHRLARSVRHPSLGQARALHRDTGV